MSEGERPTSGNDLALRIPFWDYLDVVIFVLLALPCIWLSAQAIRALRLPGLLHQASGLVLPAQLAGYLLLFAMLAVLLRVRYDQPFWRSLGWVRADWAMPWSTLTGFFLAISMGMLGRLLRVPELVQDPFRQFLGNSVTLLVLGVLVVCVGPACEELAFRGFLQPLLVRDVRPPLAVLTGALLFALLHGPQYEWQWQRLTLIGVTGIVFGWAKQMTGSTFLSAVMHSAYNATIFSFYLLQVSRHA